MATPVSSAKASIMGAQEPLASKGLPVHPYMSRIQPTNMLWTAIDNPFIGYGLATAIPRLVRWTEAVLLIYFVYLVRNPYRILLYHLQAPMQLVGRIKYYWAQQHGYSRSTLVVLRRSCGFNDPESYLLATNSRM